MFAVQHFLLRGLEASTLTTMPGDLDQENDNDIEDKRTRTPFMDDIHCRDAIILDQH